MTAPGRRPFLGISSVIGIFLSIALLFALFVYPNPSGLLFAGLRLAVVLLTGFLFFQMRKTNLERTDALSSLRTQNNFWSHLDAFERDLDIVHSFEELIAAFVRFCQLNFSFDRLTISLVDEDDSREAVVAAVSGAKEGFSENDRFSLEGTLHGRVISEGKGLRVNDLTPARPPGAGGKEESFRESLRKEDAGQSSFKSFLGAPIQGNHGVTGAIALESFDPHTYTNLDSEMLTLLAARAGLLHDWWSSYGAVREAAMRDGLTGLLNHRSFMERFEEEISRADRYQQSFVLLILDLDKFKNINDSYGHLFGDFVLREVASVLKNSVRTIDLVARYGGEEFAILLVNATKKGTVSTCERLISSVAGHLFKKDSLTVRLTISAGATEFPADGQKPSDLIARADKVMYGVKKKGGNAVAYFPRSS